MVEQLTLNQRAQGSSPWKRTNKKDHPFGWSFFVWQRFQASQPLRSADWRVLGASEMSAASGGKSESEMLTSKQSRASVQRHAPSGDNFEVGTSLRKIDLSAQTANRNALSATQSNANEGEQCDNVRGGTACGLQAVVEAAFRVVLFCWCSTKEQTRARIACPGCIGDERRQWRKKRIGDADLETEPGKRAAPRAVRRQFRGRDQLAENRSVGANSKAERPVRGTERNECNPLHDIPRRYRGGKGCCSQAGLKAHIYPAGLYIALRFFALLRGTEKSKPLAFQSLSQAR